MKYNTIKHRFALFGGAYYYPSGGLHDFVGSYATLEEALLVALATNNVHPQSDHQEANLEWWHIFDMTERQMVCRSEIQGYGANGDPSLDALAG